MSLVRTVLAKFLFWSDWLWYLCKKFVETKLFQHWILLSCLWLTICNAQKFSKRDYLRRFCSHSWHLWLSFCFYFISPRGAKFAMFNIGGCVLCVDLLIVLMQEQEIVVLLCLSFWCGTVLTLVLTIPLKLHGNVMIPFSCCSWIRNRKHMVGFSTWFL